MKRMYLLFSHKLTQEQIEDAKNNLLVDEFVHLPADLQELWGNMPPDIISLKYYLEPFRKWLNDANAQDYVLVQGDYGATYRMVEYALKKGLYPIYATTKREVVETTLPDGSIKTERIFKHCQFRHY